MTATEPGPPRWQLRRHATALAIARLAPAAVLPDWAVASGPIFAATWTATETSLICPAAGVPAEVTQAGPFHVFEVQGPLDFTLTGVLSGLLGPLADQQISVFTVSTFDTDWILVPTHQSDAAVAVWLGRGHAVSVDPDQEES
ncbi:MAG TPA: ACT domain-containing protein [Dermatophilaceae bacterium]|nr:ACT domain-containing protein [Dermatophilaceae bacterium]